MHWLAVLSFLLLTTATALGCRWDRDTLAQESLGHLDVVRTVVGDFERFPRRYYEIRAARVAREIEAPNAPVSLYDDLAAALDSLGRETEAISWMEKKAAVVERIADPRVRAEQEYRRRANLGTFYAHRWIRSADRRAVESDLRESIRWIRAALELNPRAHFDRERYQLQALEWYQAGLQPLEVNRSVPDSPSVRDPGTFVLLDSARAAEEALAGLSGIVQLGGAWQNVDVFSALLDAAEVADHASLALLIELRLGELSDAGKRSAHEQVLEFSKPEWENFGRVIPSGRRWRRSSLRAEAVRTRQFFHAARRVADENARRREEFMQKQFDRGWHPDTHSEFWRGAPVSTPLPALPGSAWTERAFRFLTEGPALLAMSGLFFVGGLALAVHRARQRRRGEPIADSPRLQRAAGYAFAFAFVLLLLFAGFNMVSM